MVAAFAARSRSISGNSVAITPASFAYDSTALRCLLPPPTGLDLGPMKMMRSSGRITTLGSGHRPKPFLRMSSSGMSVRMIPMRSASLNSFAVSPNVLPTHAPYRRFGPLRRFLARRRRMDLPSKSSMLSKMRLSPGCAAQMNMSELRNRDRSIGMTTSLPLACVKHTASTYALWLDICITTRSSGWMFAAPLYGLVKSTWRIASAVRSVAPLWSCPSDSSNSTASRSVIITRMAAARCAPTRIRSLTLVGSPMRQMMFLPSFVRRGLIPRSSSVCARSSCISSLVCVSHMMMMSDTARDVDGRSRRPNARRTGMRKGR